MDPEECNFDFPEMRSINSGQKAFQVLGDSSKIKADERREVNAFPGRWGKADVVSAGGGKEMK